MVTAPSGEIGSVEALPTWGAFAGTTQDLVEPPAWQWPQRVHTVNRMRNDAQVDSLTNSLTMPVMRLDWMLNPNGARDEVVQQISTDLGINIKGSNDPAPRSRRRFRHDDHLAHALLALWYGHMFFEQVPDLGRFDLAKDGWRLRKLAPRMPGSISKIHVAKDGGLAGITQLGYHPSVAARRRGLGLLAMEVPQIPVEALAAYVWRREGANWFGRSMLRPLYSPWTLKDRALRVDALKNERFGMGIPVVSTPEGGDPVQSARLAQAMRASEFGGVGTAPGQNVGVEGVRGSLPDVLASIRYYDESMARAFMAMVVQLGQTQTGSRALGETFSDFFQVLVEAVADWYKSTTNEHVIEDLVDWNWGEDEQAPLIEWAYPQGENALAISELVSMVDSGIIQVDPETEAWVRKRTRLPDIPERIVVPATEVAAVSRLPFAAARRGPAGGSRRAVRAHLPFQHDQQSHAGGGTPAWGGEGATTDEAGQAVLSEALESRASTPESRVYGDFTQEQRDHDPNVAMIAARGVDMGASSSVRVLGVDGECHWNASNLYREGEVDTIAIGYAYDPRVGWIQHTWGVKDGGVVETNPSSNPTTYFGVQLTPIEADSFAAWTAVNEPGEGMVRRAN